MNKFLISLVLIAANSTVFADSWTGRDKELHAIGGAAIGSMTALATKDARYGCAVATAIGLAKEVYDNQHKDRHTASFKDFAVTAAAGCLAAAGTAWIIAPSKNGGVQFSYHWKF